MTSPRCTAEGVGRRYLVHTGRWLWELQCIVCRAFISPQCVLCYCSCWCICINTKWFPRSMNISLFGAHQSRLFYPAPFPCQEVRNFGFCWQPGRMEGWAIHHVTAQEANRQFKMSLQESSSACSEKYQCSALKLLLLNLITSVQRFSARKISSTRRRVSLTMPSSISSQVPTDSSATETAQGRPMSPRLSLGAAGLKVAREKCETLKQCDEWEEFISSTDITKWCGL